MSAQVLGPQTLAGLPSRISRPLYDREDVRVGIVHLGIGGFHRSHQAAYLDELMNTGDALDWGVCGVGTMPSDRPLADAMRRQDGLYTLAVKHADGSQELRVIGSVVEYLFAPDDPEQVIQRMTDPQVRIVSLTVTEGGYHRDFSTGRFDATAPAIVADVADLTRSRTPFGMIVEALRRRRDAGVPAFTVMSCDNIPGNGDVARAAVWGTAGLADPDLAVWIAANVAFPNSMVDRITPRTTPDDRAAVTERLGLEDGCPVVCEPFAQWVLEDDFASGRPPFENIDVHLVDDVEPYELMKLRLLNCTHQGMAYFGSMKGYEHVHEAIADDHIAEFLRRYMDEEATPTLPPVPGVDLLQYKATLLDRYSNRYISDTLARLCTDGSDRIPNWLVPVIRERAARGEASPYAAAIVASWAWYCRGVDDAGRPHDVVDTRAIELVARARSLTDDPLGFVGDASLFGDLAADPSFADDYGAAIADLSARGASGALRTVLERRGEGSA